MKLPKLFAGKKSNSANLSSASSSRTSSSSSTSSSPKSTEFAALSEMSKRGLRSSKSTPVSSRNAKWGGRNSLQRSQSAVDDYQELAAAFGVIDVNGDGKISAAELGAVLRSIGDKLSDEELQLMVKAVDDDGDGYIDLQEFVNLNRMATGSDQRSEELRAAFCVFDIDKNNFISAAELHQVLRELGEKGVTMEECYRMIKGVDADGDGMVNFEEFEKMMT